MSAAIFETGSKATTTPVAPAVPLVFAFSMQAEQSIVVDPKSPGGINSPHGLILFDGVCVLCSHGCRFVSKRDRRGYFRFVPIQLAEGRPLAEQLGIVGCGRHDEGSSVAAFQLSPYHRKHNLPDQLRVRPSSDRSGIA
jgi:hypothetical protein